MQASINCDEIDRISNYMNLPITLILLTPVYKDLSGLIITLKHPLYIIILNMLS